MAVVTWRELARTASHLIGESPKFERRWVTTLDNPDTNATEIITAVGAIHYSPHPEYAFARLNNVEVNEAYDGNRYWTEVVAQYEVPQSEWRDANLLPWERPDVWKFQTQGVAVPALTWIDDNTTKPLTNSAGDFFEGVTVDEAQQKITITGNRQSFPSATAAAVTNCVNDGSYLGFGTDCVKVQGISAESAVEVVDDVEYPYWKITAELLCRQTGWNLLLPDVGFNYIDGTGKKRRAFVISSEPELEVVASANPIALNGSGGMVFANPPIPAILTRRVYKRITMSTYFGTPPS